MKQFKYVSVLILILCVAGCSGEDEDQEDVLLIDPVEMHDMGEDATYVKMPTCMDGIQNGEEVGVDCGGFCRACTDTIVMPTCTDGLQNGEEEGVDCGGPCRVCEVTPTCSDGVQNGEEEGVDCGGPCRACEMVVTPTCTDGLQNGEEEGVDCGGACRACEISNQAPMILQFATNKGVLAQGDVLRVSVVVTDPDGIDDVIGGSLTDPVSGSLYATFTTTAQEGAYEAQVQWSDINDVRPINTPFGGGERLLLAKFFDQKGNLAQQELSVKLECSIDQARAVCGGVCNELNTSDHYGACDQKFDFTLVECQNLSSVVCRNTRQSNGYLEVRVVSYDDPQSSFDSWISSDDGEWLPVNTDVLTGCIMLAYSRLVGRESVTLSDGRVILSPDANRPQVFHQKGTSQASAIACD